MSKLPSIYLNSKLFHRGCRDDRDTKNIGANQKSIQIPDQKFESIEPEDSSEEDESETKKAVSILKSELIPGGLASGKKPEDFDQNQLREAVKVESEHTSNKKLAREIGMDHLTEDPNYYKKLRTIEKADPDITGTLEGKFKISLPKMIEQLNRIVTAEYSQWMRYYHYALVLRGHSRDVLADEFEGHAEEELGHLERIAMRVISLGGYPETSMVHPVHLKNTEEILKELLRREQEGIQLYREVLAQCGENEGTRQILEGNIEQEQEHVDDLWRYLQNPEKISKAGADQESAGRETISEGRSKRSYENSFNRDAPGISGGQTPDLPDVGRDWHGTVAGVPDEPQDGPEEDESTDLDRPPIKILKRGNEEARKALAGAPRFTPGPLVPPMEKVWLQMRGYSEEDILGGRVHVTPRMRAEFNKFLNSTVQKSITSLGGWSK